MTKRDKVNIALVALVIIGIAGLILFIMSRKNKTQVQQPTKPSPILQTASESAKSVSTENTELLKTLESLDSFPEKPCPTPEGLYHTTKFAYSHSGTQNKKTVYFIRFIGSAQDLTTTMSPAVETKIARLTQNQPFTAYYYMVDKNAPMDKPSVNTTIWCFTTP